MSIKRDIVLRVRIAFILTFLVAGAVVFRIAKIQFIEGEEWRSLGETLGMQVMNVKATRGNIYADDGSLLATSLPFYRLAIDPYLPTNGLYKNNIDSLCYLLSRYYGDLTPTQYKRKIDRARKDGRRYLTLNRQEIGYQDKKHMENWPLFREGRLKGGVLFEKVEKRFLPFSHLGIRTIGSVNANDRGTVGLEYSFNKQLAGVNGKGLYQKMAGGGWKPIYDGTEKRPVDGYDIQTTINVDLQDVTESALLDELQKHNADYGVAIVMEVKTGEIKAISNLSRNTDGDYYERYNYAVGNQGSREPGSTFKLASMIALLEEVDIKLTDTINTGDGSLEFFDKTMRDHKPGGFGTLTVQEVFEKSSNIGVAKLISQHFGNEPEKFINYLKRMNLHQPLDFQMVGEGKPYIKDPSDSTWSGVSLPWMSHGYELKMTPLQMLTLYNAVANNGKMVKPMIVKGVMKADRMVEEFETEVINDRIASKETLRKVKMMMEGVVERGTAQNINHSHYKIAGKTGTAKKVKNGRYVREYYTSFAGYFPAEAPRYSCIVVIDNPKGYQIYGSDVSAPVFKEIADKIYSLELDMHEVGTQERTYVTGVFPHIKAGKRDELTMICNELGISNHAKTEAEWVKTDVINDAVYWKGNTVKYEVIPDVRGMTLRDAIYVLENLGLKVKVNGRGRVATQSLAPGGRIAKGSTIKLQMS
ncbi:cell division protein FtsI (penicillin-binding protein 3) [Ekhidna lutea]|uniref:Cell division protein FtsI (Penicillin-binding protein 3) n=1 Tax=Ekhidna lutea TaxID=447679 RepID=A0A239L166_EKHLU|nr:penicillin-binding protein [Ekhidna lutea]SNT24055.1 cell division protein FtsI (penicillin-binding protein 3) [Ekhidna lutea]